MMIFVSDLYVMFSVYILTYFLLHFRNETAEDIAEYYKRKYADSERYVAACASHLFY